MLNIALAVSAAMLGVAVVLNVWVLFRGPDLPDRILALDTLYINAIALLLLYGIARATTSFFEAALLIAKQGFIRTVALCKYLLRGDIIE